MSARICKSPLCKRSRATYGHAVAVPGLSSLDLGAADAAGHVRSSDEIWVLGLRPLPLLTSSVYCRRQYGFMQRLQAELEQKLKAETESFQSQLQAPTCPSDPSCCIHLCSYRSSWAVPPITRTCQLVQVCRP